jgi:hypothetical protein
VRLLPLQVFHPSQPTPPEPGVVGTTRSLDRRFDLAFIANGPLG